MDHMKKVLAFFQSVTTHQMDQAIERGMKNPQILVLGVTPNDPSQEVMSSKDYNTDDLYIASALLHPDGENLVFAVQSLPEPNPEAITDTTKSHVTMYALALATAMEKHAMKLRKSVSKDIGTKDIIPPSYTH